MLFALFFVVTTKKCFNSTIIYSETIWDNLIWKVVELGENFFSSIIDKKDINTSDEIKRQTYGEQKNNVTQKYTSKDGEKDRDK